MQTLWVHCLDRGAIGGHLMENFQWLPTSTFITVEAEDLTRTPASHHHQVKPLSLSPSLSPSSSIIHTFFYPHTLSPFHSQKVVRPMAAMDPRPVAVLHRPTITPPPPITATTATTATRTTGRTGHSRRSPWAACGTLAVSARRASSPVSLSSSLLDTLGEVTRSQTELVSEVDVLVT